MNRALSIAKKLLNYIIEERKATAARIVDQHRPYAELLLQAERTRKTTRTNHVAIQPSGALAEKPHGHPEMASP